MVEHFKFVRANAKATPKMTIPSPSTLHFRYGREAVPEAIYPTMDEFYRDLGATYRKVVRAFADAGCRYLQLDEVNLAYLCDPALCEQVRARGDDPKTLPMVYAGMINAAISDIPPDMTISMHLCRGNRGGQWHAEGSYEAFAEKLFNRLAIKFFFLEYDSPRAGDFAPLRFVPKDTSIVLGLVSTKTDALEDKSELRRRIEEASRFVPLERLAISPQCGFASTEVGSPISAGMQEAKLRLVVDLARETWDTA